MAITINTTCSECYFQHESELDLSEPEIRCEQCGHTVPMLDEEDYYEIERGQKKRDMMGYLAIASLVVAVLCLWPFINAMEPYYFMAGDLPIDYTDKFWDGTQAGAGAAIWGFLLGLSAVAVIVFGCIASAKKVICEF